MDPIVQLILILFAITLIGLAIFGVIPPLLVGWWAFDQGEKGKNLALKKYDDAIKKINENTSFLGGDMRSIEELIKEIKVPEIPKEMSIAVQQIEDLKTALKVEIPEVFVISPMQIEDLKTSLNASIKGSFGNIMKELYKEGSQSLDDTAKAQFSEMDIKDRIMMGIQNRIMGFIAGD